MDRATETRKRRRLTQNLQRVSRRLRVWPCGCREVILDGRRHLGKRGFHKSPARAGVCKVTLLCRRHWDEGPEIDEEARS